MVVHSSTAIWRQHAPRVIALFDADFREPLVATYAALVSNEVDPGRRRHATWDAVDVLDHARDQLESRSPLTWFDRRVWRL
jgi:hypothetical protein